MASLTITNGRLLTLAGHAVPRRGNTLSDLGVIESGWVRIEDGLIHSVGSETTSPGAADESIDAGGCVVMPAFVDCHTHACWAGDRHAEFAMKLAGASYLDILKAGGGIMSTVGAVRAASQEELAELLLLRVGRMAQLGTGTVEVKSGYGLRTGDELKMLRAVLSAQARTPVALSPTFLGAHALDADNPCFVDETISETLPAVAAEFPGITCDAYCEEGAWSVADTTRLFEAALDLGCPLRIHTDQFNSLGMTRVAVEMGAVSCDHLEATTQGDLDLLAGSETMGVALPCSGFQLNDRYAPARRFVDSGGALAISTNYNPGSSPCPSMPFTIALASRKLGLQPAEAISAATINAAHVLRVSNELGSISPGKRAHVQVLDSSDERDLGYEFATSGPRLLLIDGVPCPATRDNH